MSTSFRDSSVVIVDTSRTRIRAGHGLHELLKTPSVDILARVGLRKNASLTQTNGEMVDGGSSSNTTHPTTHAKVTDYLVGTQLDEALAAGQEVDVYWPFEEGRVKDWVQAEALWRHALWTQLGLRRVTMESPVLLAFPATLDRPTAEHITQLFFERFNVAGFSLLERPMAQFYAAVVTGSDLSGVVVDIGMHYTDVTPIHDGFVVQNAPVTLSYGIADCEQYLAQLLLANQGVVAALSPPEAPLSDEQLRSALVELARHVWQEGLIKVLAEGEAADIEEEGVTDIAAVLVAGKEKAVIESGMKKRANAKASAAELARAKEIEALDLVTVQFRERSLTLGKERHRFCEPLFDPALLAAVPGWRKEVDESQMRPLAQAVGHAVSLAEVDTRQYIWQGLFVTGDLTNHIKGLGNALQARLSPYILSAPDQLNEVQPKSIRVLKVPEYFAEYREKGDGLASFLGASIVAKIIFNDSSGRNFASKADYAERGPKCILSTSSSLL